TARVRNPHHRRPRTSMRPWKRRTHSLAAAWIVLALVALVPCLAQAAPGGIAGLVTSNNTGLPVSGANVTVSDGATGVLVTNVPTDGTGHYDTGLTLAPGTYKVSVSKAGFETIAYNNRFSIGTGDPVIVADGASTTAIDIALPLLGGITGHVRNVVG